MLKLSVLPYNLYTSDIIDFLLPGAKRMGYYGAITIYLQPLAAAEIADYGELVGLGLSRGLTAQRHGRLVITETLYLSDATTFFFYHRM